MIVKPSQKHLFIYLDKIQYTIKFNRINPKYLRALNQLIFLWPTISYSLEACKNIKLQFQMLLFTLLGHTLLLSLEFVFVAIFLQNWLEKDSIKEIANRPGCQKNLKISTIFTKISKKNYWSSSKITHLSFQFKYCTLRNL